MKMELPAELKVVLLPDPPWIISSAPSPEAGIEDVEDALSDAGVTVRILSGSKMRTKADLFAEFVMRLDFPEYFGNNWDALTDCLSDLDWLHGFAYLFVIQESNDLLVDGSCEDLEVFRSVIDRVAARWAEPIRLGEDWDRPAVPFHLLLWNSSTSDSDSREDAGS